MEYNVKVTHKEINSLKRQLTEKESEFAGAKVKRAILTIIGFFAFYASILLVILEIVTPDAYIDFTNNYSTTYLTIDPSLVVGAVIFAIMLAVIHFFANYFIFGILVRKNQSDKAEIEDLKIKIHVLSLQRR